MPETTYGRLTQTLLSLGFTIHQPKPGVVVYKHAETGAFGNRSHSWFGLQFDKLVTLVMPWFNQPKRRQPAEQDGAADAEEDTFKP